MSESRIPRIMEPAPDFEARSTHGIIRLSDYTSQDKWVMLFSHPSDFTPVCSTEFIAFAKRHEEFEKLNVQLIGVSIDSVFSHIAWIRDLEAISGVQVRFPIVADLDQQVSRAYGMVHEAVSDTAAVRAVFAIDPKGNVRALLYYPMHLGRSVSELLRIFQALQVVDANSVSTPADWELGDQVIVPAPSTLEDAAKRATNVGTGLNVQSWYLSKKDLPFPSK
jgi:peroxiredoxin (alkyl hydroperoxide reductase subunit C)